VDALRRLEDPAAPQQLKLSKGIHLVVDRASLPVNRTIIIPAGDRRSVFVVPKGGFTYIGTTDTFYPEPSHWPRIEGADVDYLLAAAKARFASPPLAYKDIVAAWSGVRPLVAEEGKSPSEISRKDEVWTGPAGVIAIAGGKLTAYRQMAERVVDLAEEALGRPAKRAPTDESPLVTGDLDPKAQIARLGGDPAAERLVALYGSEAAEAVGGPAAEARHAVLKEGALNLEDWWARRCARAFFDAEGGMAALAPAAAEMAGLLGWSATETERQVEACRRIRAESLSALNPVEA
jgi:glycerol-3-phosphate dehydrogenase